MHHGLCKALETHKTDWRSARRLCPTLCGDLNEKDVQKRGDVCIHMEDFPVTQTVKNLSAMQETWVQSLGGEDPLEKGITTHSSILAWRIPMDRGAWRATVRGVAESRT